MKKKNRINRKHIRAHAAVILSLFMILSLVGSGILYPGAGMNSAFTYAASQTSGDYEYTVSGGTVTLTAYNGKDAVPKIPTSIGGNKVTAIGRECFRGNAKITKINVPEGITSIGDYAFEACSSATSLTLPSTLKTIGKAAFSGDAQIEKIVIPGSVSKIGDGAFLYCRNAQSITGGEGLTELGQFVFAGCEFASKVDLSKASQLKALPDRSFCNCMSLFDVKLPDSIETVGKRAFSYCSALGNLEFGPNVKTVGDYAFEKCSGLTELSFEGGEGLKIGNHEFHANDGAVQVHLILPNNTVITDTTFSGTKLGGVYVSGDGILKSESGKVRLIENGQIYEDGGTVLVNALPEKYDSKTEKWIPVTETVSDESKSYTRYTVDSKVRRIAGGAFDETSFGVVVLPKDIETLDEKAFYGAEIKAISINGDSSKFVVKDGMLYEKAEADGNGGLGATLGTARNPAVTESPSDADKTVSSDPDNTASTDDSNTGATDADNTTSTDDDSTTATDSDSTGVPETDNAGATDADNTAATDTDSAAAEDSNADVTAGNGEEASANEDTAGKETVEEGTGNDAAPPKLLLGAAGAGYKYRLLRFFKYKEEDNKLVRITEEAEGVPDDGPTQKFNMPSDVVSIAPYAFSNAGVHIDVASALSTITFESNSFTNSGICDPRIEDDDAQYYGSIINYDAIKDTIDIKQNAFEGYATYFPYEDEEADPDSQIPDELTGDDTEESDRDFNDRFARRDDIQTDGEEYPEMPGGDGSYQEPDSTVKYTSVSGNASLYSDRKYSGYQVIPNSGFPAWSDKYIDYNKDDIKFSQYNMPYTMLYKGEAHYRSMVCVLNHDQYKTDYSIRNVGDDFAPMYLTMDHALEAEIQRGGVPDDIVLYSGITVERMADIAGTDKSSEEPPSLDQLKNAIGKEFTDPAFMSTTTNPSVAASFSSHSNTMIVIYASSEALSKLGAVVIDSFSGWGAGEYEILLNLGARFKVLDVGTMEVGNGGDMQYERQYIRLQLLVDDEFSSVTYDLNGGSYNGSTENIVEKQKTGEVINIHDAPEREGYTFSYWKGSEYNPGDTYVMNGNHKLTAVWVADKDSNAADSSDDASGDENNGGRKSVRTGDDSNLAGWLILMLIAAVCECGIVYARRRR